jgi:hypothetical protein
MGSGVHSVLLHEKNGLKSQAQRESKKKRKHDRGKWGEMADQISLFKYGTGIWTLAISHQDPSERLQTFSIHGKIKNTCPLHSIDQSW